MLLRQDGFSREQVKLQRDALLARTDDRGRRRLRAAARAYLRRDFHPDEVDDLPLAHRRLAELGLEAPA